MRHGIVLTQILKQRRERRELAPDSRWRELSVFKKLFAPSDDMCAGDAAKFLGTRHADKRREVGDVARGTHDGSGIGQVGQTTLSSGGHLAQSLAFTGVEGVGCGRHACRYHHKFCSPLWSV